MSGVPSRVNGTGPLAVFFDASATTSTATTKPFHELLYKWDFGDANTTAASTCPNGAPAARVAGEGYWACGSPNNTKIKSKNYATGPVAAHVFEKSGTYKVNLTVTDGTNTVSNSCLQIAVQAADTTFAGSNTVCISSSGNFTGCPTGATQVTNSNATTAVSGNIGTGGKRILFRRGETFSVASAIAINKAGPGIIGAFGTGAKPLLNSTSAGAAMSVGASDWRIADLQINGNLGASAEGFGTGGMFTNVLFLRNDVRNVKFGWDFSVSALGAGQEWDGFFVVDSTLKTLVPTPGNGGNGMYICAKRLAIMGNHVDTDQGSEHGIRTCHTDRGVYAHNTVEDIASGRAFLSIRSPGQGSIQLGSGVYTEKVEVSDNRFFGGATTGMAGTGPTNGTSTGMVRNEIWERNLFEGSSTTNEYLNLQGVSITARNNIFRITNGGTMVTTQPLAAAPVPDKLYLYNNSIYASGAGGGYFSVIQNETGDMTASVITIQNNLTYSPNAGTGNLITNSVGATVTTCSTCNTANSERTTNPNYTVTPPTVPSHFKPTTNSYAIGRGIAVPVYEDYFGVTTSGLRDMGAVIH
jgi:hypothetical protein